MLDIQWHEYCGHKSNKDYISINKDGEPVPGNSGNANGTLFYHVNATCTGIPCQPFATNNYITCVVYTNTPHKHFFLGNYFFKFCQNIKVSSF